MKFFIGKDPDFSADSSSSCIVIDHETVSRWHGELECIGSVWFFRDANSTNGSFRKNMFGEWERKSAFKLLPGETIRLGEVEVAVDDILAKVSGFSTNDETVMDWEGAERYERQQNAENTEPASNSESVPADDFSGTIGAKRFFALLFSAGGRLNRAQFILTWLGVSLLGSLIMFLIFGLIGENVGDVSSDISEASTSSLPLGVAVYLLFYLLFLTTWIMVAALVKRLHDANQSGKWVMALPVPLLNVFLVLFCLLKAGSVGANRYGMPP